MLYFFFNCLAMFGLLSTQTNEPFRYVLTDIEQNQESFEIKSHDTTPDCPFPWSVKKYVLLRDTQEPIVIINVDNGQLQFDVAPTRGMSITQVSMGDLHLGQDSNEKVTVQSEPNRSQGQKQPEKAAEWMIRSGLDFSVTSPSQIEVIVERQAPFQITIRGKTRLADVQKQNLEFVTEISTVPGTNSFNISDKATNLKTVEQEFDIGYRTNYSMPFIKKGSKLISPTHHVIPVNKESVSMVSDYNLYSDTSGSTEQIFLLEFWTKENKRTKIMLQNNEADSAVLMDFSTGQLPFFTLWKKPSAQENEPVMSLEAGTNLSIKRENVQKLAPNQSRSYNIEFTFLSDANQVNAVAKEIAAIQTGRKTKIVKDDRSSSTTNLADIVKAAKTWRPTFQNWFGKPAPDFALLDISGKVHRLSDYRGKNVLVIFWATWCGPCLREIPDLIELRKTVTQDDLAILAISNENSNLVKRFIAKAKINYDVLLDQGTLPMPYNSIQAIPSGFFINPDGKIKLATLGMVSLTEIKMILQATQ